MKEEYFAHIKDVAEVKKEYRRLVKIYHPDTGNSVQEDTIKFINNQYEAKLESLNNTQFRSGDRYDKETKTYKPHYETYKFDSVLERDLMQKIRAFQNCRFDGSVVCDLCNLWLWVSNASDVQGKRLETLGFIYHGKKNQYYYRNDSIKMAKTKGRCSSFSGIQRKYGSQRVGNYTNDSGTYLN